jgi:pimeloyl-ACP methyl ester carboxylesterase
MRTTFANPTIPGVTSVAVTAPRLLIDRPPALFMPSAALGGFAGESFGIGLTAVRAKVRAIAQQGFEVVAPTTGFTFGVSGMPDASPLTGAGQMEASLAYHGGTGRAVLMGVSMGCANSLIYALEHPGQVAAMVLMSPAFDLKNVYMTNFDGNRVALGAAWGVVYPAPFPPVADVMTRAPELAGIPIFMPYASDDAYSFDIATFAAAIGPSAVIQNVGAVGHGNGTVLATSTQAVIDFVQEHAG